MKFCKRYSQFLAGQDKKISYVEFKRMKKILKACTTNTTHHHHRSSSSSPSCPSECSVCDGTFFPLLLKEVTEVVGCFNARAKKLLQLHLATGFEKYLLCMKYRCPGSHQALIHEGSNLVSYASMNALAIRKILKKYDKVHYSRKGRAFKTKLQALHVELLQSPWLIELAALHFNLEDTKASLPKIFSDCSYDLDSSSKPTITCTLYDSIKIEVDLTCSICLEMVFDPIALGCGHIFCTSCACSAALVTSVEGVKAAAKASKCPLCRQAGVYADAVRLGELATFISTRCKPYWVERLKRERVERLRQAKEHWNEQCRVAMGL